MDRTISSRQEALKVLDDLIRDIPICMMTTTGADGTLHSRPMVAVQEEVFDGTLWFFTSMESDKVDEAQTTHQVNLAYVDSDSHVYVSVAGESIINHETERMQRLWNPMLKAWFPKGLNDPDLCLLRIDISSAHYWDTPSHSIVSLGGLVRAMTTGAGYDPGEHGSLEFSGHH